MTKIVSISALIMASSAMAAGEGFANPVNAASGIWLQTVGELVPHAPTSATLYYTKYEDDTDKDGKPIGDRVKSISYTYNGAGYLLMKPSDRKTVCSKADGIEGADGIVHHPDGKHLLIAGQGQRVYMVDKNPDPGQSCYVKKATPNGGDGFWHLMMDGDPSTQQQKWVWAANIPGKLYRFSTDMRADANGVMLNKNGLADKGYKVKLVPDKNKHRGDSTVATVIWDDFGRAYFTCSGYLGGGCEGTRCTQADRDRNRADAYFGILTDTVWTKVTSKNQKDIGGFVGDSVITQMTKKVLIDSLEGAHGGTYDPYSGSIFVFGGSKIVQIQPYKNNGTVFAPEVIATLDLREFFFNDDGFKGQNKTNGVNGWRLDQGTVDGKGHLFVASNTGHMIFVDYAASRIVTQNVFVHVQWMDAFLDDLAPLPRAAKDLNQGSIGTETEASSSSRARSSSSLVEYSSSAKSSSSSKPASSSSSVNEDSSDSNNSSSSGENPGSSGSNGSSSSIGVPGSSGSNGSSSSTGVPGSSGSNDSSSSTGVPGSSGSGDSSSSTGVPGSSGSGDSSSSGGVPGSSGSNGSSSSKGNAGGDGELDDQSSSSKNLYYDAEDDYTDDDGYDAYPSADAFDNGDSIVSSATILVPTDPSNPDPNVIVIGGTTYLPSTDPADMLDFHYNSDLNSATVGEVVAVTLDKDRVDQYFGSIDSLKIVGTNHIEIVDPKDDSRHETIFVNNDGSVTILITAEEAVEGGSIKIYGNGNVVIVDNINFVDPTPDARIGYIKDSDGNNTLDYVEVLLKEPLDPNAVIDVVRIVVGKDTLICSNDSLNKDRDRIIVDVDDLKDLPLAGEFPKDATVLVTYKYTRGTLEDGTPKTMTYVREAPLLEVGSNVIKDAYAIRDTNGLDSLFLQFNIDLVPADLGEPEMLVLFKEAVCRGKDKYDSAASLCALKLDQVKKVYMPTKDIVILVAKDFQLEGDMKDSVSLFEGKTFYNLQYVTSDEYLREVPVTVVDRFPSIVNVEYWDTDGDGVLDQIVSVFDGDLTADDIDNTLYLTFPWFSSRGMLTNLQAYPASLRVDPKDPTRVIWDVASSVSLAKGVTDISDKLPAATAYTYYTIFGETFVNEATAPLVDKMSPIVSGATLNYGKKADTLVVHFSEPIKHSKLKGNDFFAFIHGEETIDLNPMEIVWSADGYSATLIIDGSATTIMPGDSLLVKHGKDDTIRDNYDNIAGEHPQPVIIGGLLNHLVESTNMGSYDANGVVEDEDTTYTMKTVSSVNIRYLPSSATKESMEKEGALGHLIQLGERFVPQLLDQAQVSADGSFDPSVLDSLKPENVLISFIVNFSDHLGQYVNDTIISVPCNSPKFGGNCLATDKKVFVNWNFKDHNGRFVGDGVYTVQFKMVVRYENKKIEEEMKDKWGVRRKKHKKK
ncbi:MAG: hypothetical protein MJZ05_04345 [Fibrobacter sp.]|nr:hypothetical protein [Fibrobacter sp.]